MSILDLKKRVSSRRQVPNADPAHAFGSQEQIMSEFQRQEYIPPENAARRAVGKASEALSSLRDRISRPARTYETDAPMYSADTYAQPAAPDLGWEAAFDPNAAPPASAAPNAQERFDAFRKTVYDSPYRQNPAPVYEEISFTAPTRRESTYTPPVYEEISFTSQAPRENTYAKPVYEELDLTGRSAPPYARSDGAPAENTPYVQPAAPAEGHVGPSGPGMQPVRQAASGSDFQYFFWSMSILTGAALTLFSFVYACVF